MPRPARPALAAVPSRKPEPIFDLVKADPPAPKPKRVPLAEQLRPLLEQLVSGGDDTMGVWYRIVLYPTARGAAISRGRAQKAYSKGWEWQSARIDEVDQSALYVRRVQRDARL